MQQSLNTIRSKAEASRNGLSRVAGPLLALSFALATPSLALGTPAGTVIRNEATLEYTNEGQPPVTVTTPPVETTIAAMCSVSVLPNGSTAAPGQSITLDPGQSGVLRYQVTNTGNATLPFSLSAASESASQFTPQLAVYSDVNGNGVIDGSDAPLTSLNLAADQSANVLVQVGTATTARGVAYPNLVASCAGNVAGNSDGDNVARVELTNPPELALQKTFTPAAVRPGELTTVNIALTNAGGVSQEAVLTDLLNTPEMRDFVFQSGSARLGGSAAAGAVLEYTADGVNWNTAQPATVAGIRARVPSISAGASLTLSFSLQAPRVEATRRTNVATVTSAGQTIDTSAVVTITPVAQIALGPQGNPQANPGGEMSADDRQVRADAVAGQPICFRHTVQNLGDLPDTITTTADQVPAGVTAQLRDLGGQALANNAFVVTLEPQATADFQVCYVLPTTASTGFESVLISRSSRGAADNRTVDQVTTVYPNTVQLTKVSDKGEGELVSPGEEVTYTLSFTNTFPVPLTNVVVRDPLGTIFPAGAQASTGRPLTQSSTSPAPLKPAASLGALVTTAPRLSQSQTSESGLPVEFVRADNGGTLVGNEVVWNLGTVQPGQQVVLHVTVRIPAGTSDGSVVRNVFTFTSDQLPEPPVSPPATNTVFDSGNFTLVKESNPPTVVPGEKITYVFTVTNQSKTVPLKNVRIQDILPEGLDYIADSSGFRPAGQGEFVPLAPQIDAATRTYIWTIPVIEAGKAVEVRFEANVNPEAPAQLRNNAVARAVASERETNSRPSLVNNVVQPLSFGVNNADIIGYVFLDRNRNGVYDYRFDLPYPKARVILADGRIALTDNEGRYHFRNVREQTWSLRLDPNSVVFSNLSVPQDGGRLGSRQVYVRSLTSVDFPLAPDTGDIAVIRDTTLRVTGGPEGAQKALQVQKKVFTTTEPNVYRVQLILSNAQALPGMTLTDPLPTGAKLVDGDNVMSFDPLPTGERAVTYRFRWLGDPKGAVTDPTASWRY